MTYQHFSNNCKSELLIIASQVEITQEQWKGWILKIENYEKMVFKQKVEACKENLDVTVELEIVTKNTGEKVSEMRSDQ